MSYYFLFFLCFFQKKMFNQRILSEEWTRLLSTVLILYQSVKNLVNVSMCEFMCLCLLLFLLYCFLVENRRMQ